MAGRKKATKTVDRVVPVQKASERQALADRIAEEKAYKAMLGGDLRDDGHIAPAMPGEGRSVDTSKLDHNIGRMEAALKAGEVEPLSGAKRARAEAELKEVQKYIREKALTQREMQLYPRHGADYASAVRKSKKNEVGNPEFTRKANRLRELEMALYPDDPDAGSVERLRKKN